jgi:hypothetical protein
MPRRARQNAEQLFNRNDFYSMQQHQRQKMLEAVGEADSELIRSADAEELRSQFADRFALEAPTLTDAALSVTVDEAEVDVTGDFRFGAWGPGPHSVPGIRVTYYVPYSGEREMFNFAPSTRNLSLRPVELRDGELRFAYERPDQDVMSTKPEVDREIQQVKESLDWLRRDCQAFNATLPQTAMETIEARKSRLAQMSQGTQSIGIPIRKAAAAINTGGRSLAKQTVRGRTHAPPRKPVDHYDIALSFAGENRDYVEEVANGLKAAGVNVFYDRFETAKLWGKNLIDHLANVYQNSRYVVMFVSKEYVEKAWTTHERTHAQDRALFAQEEYILPARFDDTPVPGMTSTVAFQDLRHTTPQQLVDLILTKLQRRVEAWTYR